MGVMNRETYVLDEGVHKGGNAVVEIVAGYDFHTVTYDELLRMQPIAYTDRTENTVALAKSGCYLYRCDHMDIWQDESGNLWNQIVAFEYLVTGSPGNEVLNVLHRHTLGYVMIDKDVNIMEDK